MSKLLEVCVENIESACAAIEGGADRLELCSSLIDGGLTPTPGLLILLQQVRCRPVPVYCMIRCRPGNFLYTQTEVEVMKEDVRILRQNGADGFVFGALTENGDVDMKVCREIIKACHPLPVTFHRAFDLVKRPTIEIEVIIDLGFRRLLTSGKQNTAQLGVKLIKKLVEQVGQRITIVAGGGINKENVRYILENAECNEVHGSFRVHLEKVVGEKEEEEEEKVVGEGVVIGERSNQGYVTDESAVAEIVNLLRTV